MWSFSYTLKNKRIVCRTKIYFTQHQHIVKRIHHLRIRSTKNNRNKIIKSDNTANTHKQSESTTLTQPNNLHIERERAQADLTNTHIQATHRKFMNLHTLTH